jgi:uncharacterized protein YqgV (UPF0045/DUF77 family)
MGTIFEAKNIKEVFKLVRKAHEAVFDNGVKRVVTTVRIDDRRDTNSEQEKSTYSIA